MTDPDERSGKQQGDDALWKNLADDASLIDIFNHIVDDGDGPEPNLIGTGDDVTLGHVWDELEHDTGRNLQDPAEMRGAGAGGVGNVGAHRDGSSRPNDPRDRENQDHQRRSLDERGSGGGSGVGPDRDNNPESLLYDGNGSAVPAFGFMRGFPAAAGELVRLRREGGDNTRYKGVSEDQFEAKNLALRIGQALTEMSEGLECGSLVQLFIPTVSSGNRAVTLCTSSDLARVKTVHGDKFRRYHEASRAFVFDVSPSAVDSTHGVPGRVFLYKNPEWTPSVCCYRPTEYLRLAIAIDCLVQSSLAFPVFTHDPQLEPHTQTPIGVVEIMLDTQTTNLGDVFDFVSACVRRRGMFTCGSELLASETAMRRQIADTLANVSDTSNVELEHMCRALGVPFAQCWLPSSEDPNRLVAAGAPFFVNDRATAPYRLLSAQTALLPTHGPVGRAHDKGRMIWMDNVQEGSQADWPLQHAAALLGLRGVCACTLGLDAKDGGPMIEAVLEVFLPCNLTTSEQQQVSLDALWGYLQQSEHLHMLLDADGVGVTGGGEGGPGSAGRGHQNQTGPGDSQTQNGPDGSGAFQGDAFKRPGPAVGESGDPRPPWGVTLEMLQQHFNKHLKEAAKDLGVGSTTLKRICRHFGISRWPRRSLKSKQGKLHNALKTLSAYGGNEPGGSMHGGSMMTGLTGTTVGTSAHGDASLMSLGGDRDGDGSGDGDGNGNGNGGGNDPWDAGGGANHRGQSVHGPLAGAVGSGNFNSGMADAFAVPIGANGPGQLGAPRPSGSRGGGSLGGSGGSHHGGTGFPFPTHGSDDDRSGGSPHGAGQALVRGKSARGGTVFGGDRGGDYGGGGSSRGNSTRGGNQLLGMKRGVGDVPQGGGGIGNHNGSGSNGGLFNPGNGGFSAPPDGKRGASWHGGTAAAAAMNDDHGYQGRMEKTSHGGNFAFAHMGLGGGQGGDHVQVGYGNHGNHNNTGNNVGHRGQNSPRSPQGGSMAGGSHHGGSHHARGSFGLATGTRVDTHDGSIHGTQNHAGGGGHNKNPFGSGGSGGGGESFLADHPVDQMTCKIIYGDDIVRMTLSGDMGLGHVVDRLVSSVDTDAQNLRLRYQDEDGEWCTLNTDADLNECRVATKTLGGSIRIQASDAGK